MLVKVYYRVPQKPFVNVEVKRCHGIIALKSLLHLAEDLCNRDSTWLASQVMWCGHDVEYLGNILFSRQECQSVLRSHRSKFIYVSQWIIMQCWSCQREEVRFLGIASSSQCCCTLDRPSTQLVMMWLSYWRNDPQPQLIGLALSKFIVLVTSSLRPMLADCLAPLGSLRPMLADCLTPLGACLQEIALVHHISLL